MPDQEKQLYAKQVPETLIASIRFQGDRGDLHQHLARLWQQVGLRRNGNPICLRHGGDVRCGFSLEICLPISGAVESEPLSIKTLEGGPMICARHECLLGALEDENSLSPFWRSFYAAIAQRNIGLAEGPPREVYLLGGLDIAEKTGRVIVELQEYLLLPRWLDKMALGLDRLAGEQTRRQVMAGCENLTAFSSAPEQVRWAQQALRRLDAMVDRRAGQEIMAGCAHVFPEERIQQLRAEYQRLGNIDGLLEIMGRDRSLGQYSYYGQPRRENQIIYETKLPQNPEAYQEARGAAERRAHYCHCPIIKAAIRTGEPISPTFCYCGSGWFQRLWSGILGQPVRVEVVKTVLRGDDACTFAIHLPPGIVETGETLL